MLCCIYSLKDEEDKPVVSDKDLTQMVSSCGNVRGCLVDYVALVAGRKTDNPVVCQPTRRQCCSQCFKGDAFRCGSCPFLGKPAFKPGMEKVLLNLDADDF